VPKSHPASGHPPNSILEEDGQPPTYTVFNLHNKIIANPRLDRGQQGRACRKSLFPAFPVGLSCLSHHKIERVRKRLQKKSNLPQLPAGPRNFKYMQFKLKISSAHSFP
jgi:hypothetical protein